MAIPTQFYEAFGINADPGTINSIPETTATPGAASFDKGFPLLTMTAPASGGVPPFGQDMNGILEQITDVLTFLNSGQAFVYSSGFSTQIGGYPPGAVVASARTDIPGTGFWLNISGIVNTTDPDAGGAGWAPVNNYGSTAVTLTGSNHTLTAEEYARYFIVLTGTLTANVNLIFPALQQAWLVVNRCTLAGHTVTCKTASGSGVVVPAGGYAQPSGVYSEGVNIYNDFSPLSVPIDVAPTASTLVERDTSGNVNANRFNQDAGLENPTIGSVAVQNNAADGFMRWISKANFLSQMFPASGGAVSLGAFQVRWGTNTGSNAGVTVSFSTPFPNNCFGVVATNQGAAGGFNSTSSYTVNNFNLKSATGVGATFWIAIGN